MKGSQFTSGFTFVDLFAGAGGLTEGFKEAGFRCLLATDRDEDCAATHRLNHPEIPFYDKPIETLSSTKVKRLIGDTHVDLVIGGPPCQGFSVNAPSRRWDDPRNHLFAHFVRIVKALQPYYIVFENVPGLVSTEGGKLLLAIYGAFERNGYRLNHRILFAAHYGVPQERWRLFFIGTRLSQGQIRFAYPTHYANGVANFTGARELTYSVKPMSLFEQLKKYVSVREAIGDLPQLGTAGGEEIAAYTQVPLSDFQRAMRKGSNKIYHHVAPRIAAVNVERMKHIPPGGSWRDIPFDLLPLGMKRARRSDHTKRYGRMDPDKPSCTVMTKCDPHWGSYFHWDQNRVITPREAARLQSFPDRYRFSGSRISQYRQIGNAVPPFLAKAVAEEVKLSLDEAITPKVLHSSKQIADSIPS